MYYQVTDAAVYEPDYGPSCLWERFLVGETCGSPVISMVLKTIVANEPLNVATETVRQILFESYWKQPWSRV